MRCLVCLMFVWVLVALENPGHAQKKKKAPPPSIDLKGKSLKQVFDGLLPGMGAADLGARNGPQQAWQRICVEASAPGKEKLRFEVCELMAAKLGADVPTPARTWLLHQLQRLGGEESVDKVAAAAKDKDPLVHDGAVRCLANIPSPKATTALVGLLSETDASAKVGVLNALGHRKDHAAIPAIAKQLGGKDKSVVQAAARTLGRMPGPQSAKVLASARSKAPKDALAAVNDAYLSCADQLSKAGKTKDALAIYQELNKATEPKATRLAALRGVLHASGDDAGTLTLEILRGDDSSARQIAIAHIENLSAGALKTVGQHLDKLPISSQVMALTAMAARGDKSLLPIAAGAGASKENAVARAAILALGKVGDASVVPLLLGKIGAKAPHSAAALDSLARIAGEDVNQELIAALDLEKAPAKAIQIIEVLGRRKALSAIPTLLKNAEHMDASVRNAAFTGLGAIAEPKDVKRMVEAFLKLDKKGREQTATAIVEVCARESDLDKRADPVLAVFADEERTSKHEDRASLLVLMGRLGGAKALKEINALLASDKTPLSEAAHEALFNWPDDSGADVLAKIAQDAKTTPRGRTAIRSLARVCAVPGGSVPVEKKLDLLKKAMACADREEERRAVLERIGFVRHIDTLRYVMPYLDDKALAQSACRAVVELAHSKMLREPNRAEFHKALDRVLATTNDKKLRERAKDYKLQP